MEKNILRDARDMVYCGPWSIPLVHGPWSAHWIKVQRPWSAHWTIVQGHFWTRYMVGCPYGMGCQGSWLFFFGVFKLLIVLLFGIKYGIYWHKKVTEAWRQVQWRVHAISIIRVEESVEELVIEGEGRSGYTNRWVTKWAHVFAVSLCL